MNLVGIVVVSHSHPLATAAVELALEMVHDTAPNVRIAAGTSDGGFGTDAMAVSQAIVEADAGAGVLVCADIGSAIMSTEMALEFLESDGPEVQIAAGPFVEGLLAAIVQAATGANLSQVASEATRALQAKQDALDPGAAEEHSPGSLRAELALPNPAGIHARPAARIVAEMAKYEASVRVAGSHGAFVNASSPIALASLRAGQGDRIHVETSGPQAQDALEAMVHLVEEGFGELTHTATESSRQSAQPERLPQGVSPGRVVGPAYVRVPPMATPPTVIRLSRRELSHETQRLRRAILGVAKEYEQRADAAVNREIASILRATAVLAQDETLIRTSIEMMEDSRVTASTAFWEAVNQSSALLQGAGGRIAERVTDLLDIRNRVVSELLGLPMPGLPESDVPYILMAEDLAPSDASALSSGQCLAIVTRDGGLTSHTSILARSMGIPAVVGFQNLSSIAGDSVVLVDGSTGEVIVNPSEAQRATARTAPLPLIPLEQPGALSDGTPVPLLANVSATEGAVTARMTGAHGVGLLRTEMCFLKRTEEPSVAEQRAIYRSILDNFPGSPVVIRTIDAGSDKPMPFLTMPDEENPALGVRGFRTTQIRPEVLARQLEAIKLASSTSSASAMVMAPMISTVDEAESFMKIAREAGIERAGVMIETPAAALMADELLSIVDFVSVGTNDLSQYTMAADRLSSELAGFLDPWQPAVLRLLKAVGDAGRRWGKPVGICGEAAADPQFAPVLVGLGATSLSMSPRSLHTVGEALHRVSSEDCRRAAAAACEATSPGAAREAAAAALK